MLTERINNGTPAVLSARAHLLGVIFELEADSLQTLLTHQNSTGIILGNVAFPCDCVGSNTKKTHQLVRSLTPFYIYTQTLYYLNSTLVPPRTRSNDLNSSLQDTRHTTLTTAPLTTTPTYLPTSQQYQSSHSSPSSFCVPQKPLKLTLQ